MNAIKRKPMKKAGPRLVNIVITRNASTVGFNVWNAVPTAPVSGRISADLIHSEAGFANFEQAEKDAVKYCKKKNFKVVQTTLVTR